VKEIEIDVLDCTAQQLSWRELEEKIGSIDPDIVAASAFATCTVYSVLRTFEVAKNVNPGILTITGGQYFTAMARESLVNYPEIDVIIRGEGEVTLTELVQNVTKKSSFQNIAGLSFRYNGNVIHTKPRSLIQDLNKLPYPGYHFVRDHLHDYHFAAMAGPDTPYALIEGARGCSHRCSFCSQWGHWGGVKRFKTPARIADEIEYCYNQFDSRFIWLTDDDFGPGRRADDFANELRQRDIGDDLMLFFQWRCDDVVQKERVLTKLRKVGLYWVMMGVETSDASTLASFRKGLEATHASKAVQVLKEQDIFSHAMFVVGDRKDTHESIEQLRTFADELDPDFGIFTALTPFPGTDIYEEAKQRGWIEDFNLSHYDMAHAIMPTETLSRMEVQEELYNCYRSFYGSWRRRLGGLFASNKLKSRLYRHMMGQGVVRQFKNLIQLKV
jgi:anaerobic magnesium-protoporphyrin IX monomethyl ester cyclase